MSRKSSRKSPSPTCVAEERAFLYLLAMVVRCTDEPEVSPHMWTDILGWFKYYMKVVAKTYKVTEFLCGDDGATPWASDIVLGLYELATRTYFERHHQEMIWKILSRCSNHEFTPFIRLANARHNPNEWSRRMACQTLYALAQGARSTWLNVPPGQWQRGAKWRINQLIRGGRYFAPIIP